MEIFELGFIVPCILLAAFLLWHAGLRDPFLLTLVSMILGGAAGAALQYGIDRIFAGRKRT